MIENEKFKKNVKAQVFSMDMILGIIIFILIMAGLVSIFFFGNFNKPVDAYNYEMDYIYINLERNLAQQNNNIAFMHNSRIDTVKLRNFAVAYENQSIDEFVIGSMNKSRGIGLDPSAYDTCLYFTDNNNSIIRIGGANGVRYLGRVEGGTCDYIISDGSNPCDEYSGVVSMLKPVLLDFGNFRANRIIQMNLVVCKK